jgi:hypothetical protein
MPWAEPAAFDNCAPSVSDPISVENNVNIEQSHTPPTKCTLGVCARMCNQRNPNASELHDNVQAHPDEHDVASAAVDVPCSVNMHLSVRFNVGDMCCAMHTWLS